MGILNFAKKNWIVLSLISIIYFLYISLFIKPWNLNNFSLTDDGQVLMQSGLFLKQCVVSFQCSKFVDQTLELSTGRYRPVYWMIQSSLYQIFGNHPELLHLFRLYVVGYMAVISLVIILLNLSVNPLLILLSSLLFFTNYSFSENLIRLGPNEPYQVLFLAIFSLIYLNIQGIYKLSLPKYIYLTIFLILTVLIKETNIAILPTLVLTELIIDRKKIFTPRFMFFVLSPILIMFLIYIVKKFIPSTIATDIPVYTDNYLLNPIAIFRNSLVLVGSLFNSMSPYLKISILLTPLLIVAKEQWKILFSRKFLYWLFFSIFFVGIMFPWKYLLDRYLLIGIFGLSIVIALVFDRFILIFKNLFKSSLTRLPVLYGAGAILFILLMNLFSRGFALNLARTINYAKWYAEFTTFEADQVRELAKYNGKGLYINGVNNLNDWEFLYEIPIHLRFIYGLEANANLYAGKISPVDYLFSRSSFDSYLQLDEVFKLRANVIATKSYSVDQIDPLAFRDKFVMKPLETIVNPPLQKEGYTYFWEIRQIRK